MSNCGCGGSNPCNNMLLKYFGFDCNTSVAGNYVIKVEKDTCGKCNAYFVTETASTTDCNGVATCISTNLAAQNAIRDLLINLINSDVSVQSAICGVNCGISAPANVTNLTTTDSNGGAYDCGNPILNWTASAGATSYDIFEGATLLGNVTGTTYTVSGASVGSHTYTVVAKNSGGSASGVSITVNVSTCLSAPSNVTGTINVYNSGTATNYTCGLGFDVDFTDVSGATYYQLFEGATQIGSNSATSNFVVTGQTAGSHTYTIYACNGAGCSTGTNFSVTINICGPTPLLSNTITGPLNLIQSGNVNNSILFDLVSNAHNPITGGQSIYNPTGTGCRRAKVTLNVVGYNFSGGLSGTPSIFMEITGINGGVETRTNLTDVPNGYSGSQEKYRAEHILPGLVDPSYNQTMVFEVTANDFLDMGLSGIIYIGGMVVPPDAYLDLTIGSGSKFEIFAC